MRTMNRFLFSVMTLLFCGIMQMTAQTDPSKAPAFAYQSSMPKDSCHYVVAKDGSGDFKTVQEAIDAVPDFRKKVTRIYICKGVYKEKIVIAQSKQLVALYGEDGAVLSYDDHANTLNAFGEKKGTSGSSSIYIYGSDFYAENITFQNTAGPVGQAVACFVAGDRVHFRKCRFLGFQDTLYTWGKISRQYYENCYIEGTVDFIFGASTAVFNRCQIHSKTAGYVTAPSTWQTTKYGYVFYNCRLTAEPGLEDTVYLSRPWRPYGQAVFIHCHLGSHIRPEGWDPWGKESNKLTAFYAEYQNEGPGADISKRVEWSHQLPNLRGYTMQEVLAGSDGWAPYR